MLLNVLKNCKRFKCLYIEKLTLICLGFNIKTKSAEEDALKRPLWFYFNLMAALLWILSMISYSLKHFDDVDKLAITLTVFLPCFQTLLKIIVFFIKRNKCAILIRKFENLVQKANEKELQKWTDENRLQQVIATAYYISCYSTGITFMATPLFLSLLHYIQTDNVVLYLPFYGLFPYDYTQPLSFVFTYCWSLLSLKFIVYGTIGLDTLFGWYIFNMSAHFRILQVKLEKTARLLKEADQQYFQRLISEVAAYHQQTLELANELDSVFSPLVFIQVTVDCLHFCFTTYQISMETETKKLALPIFVLITVLFQLTLYCFGGQKIQDESVAISDTIYLSIPWHRVTPKMKSSLLLPLMRAQRPCILTGIFFVADRNLLVWVIKTAGSFSAFLKAVDEEE